MNYFYYESNFKIFIFFFLGGGGGGGGEARVSDFLKKKNPNLKKHSFFEGEGGRCTDRQTG